MQSSRSACGTQAPSARRLAAHDLVNNFGGGGVKVDIDALLRYTKFGPQINQHAAGSIQNLAL
jgi:hypothetical protein